MENTATEVVETIENAAPVSKAAIVAVGVVVVSVGVALGVKFWRNRKTARVEIQPEDLELQ